MVLGADAAFETFLDRIMTYSEAQEISRAILLNDAFYYYPFVVHKNDLPVYWEGNWSQSGGTNTRICHPFQISFRKYLPKGRFMNKSFLKLDLKHSYNMWLLQIENLETGVNFSATWCEWGLLEL